MDVVANLGRVRQRIERAGGDPDAIRIVAVTKGHPVDAVRAALDAGLVDVGENYAQELAEKADVVDGARWHFIGRLQRNKVRVVSPWVVLWQSVDRIRVAEEIAARSPGAALLVQVDLTGDPDRGGAPPGLVPGIVDAARDLGLDVRGLMCVAPNSGPDAARAAFRSVRELADRLDLPERSMGMSDDLEIAVREGATMLRIGSALFGPRPRVAG